MKWPSPYYMQYIQFSRHYEEYLRIRPSQMLLTKFRNKYNYFDEALDDGRLFFLLRERIISNSIVRHQLNNHRLTQHGLLIIYNAYDGRSL